MVQDNQNGGERQDIAPSTVYSVKGSPKDYTFVLKGADLVLIDANGNEQVFLFVGNIMSLDGQVQMVFDNGETLETQGLFNIAEMPEMEEFESEQALWDAAEKKDTPEEDPEGNTDEQQGEKPTDEPTQTPGQQQQEAQAEAEKSEKQTEKVLAQQREMMDKSGPGAETFEEQDEKPPALDANPSSSSPSENSIPGEPLEPIVPAPTIKLKEATNSGSKSDNITNYTEPEFEGTAEPHSTVKIYLDGVLIETVSATGDGLFSSLGPDEPLEEGTYQVSVTATQPGASQDSDIMELVIDLTPPELPTFELAPESDTGTSAVDKITNDDQPTFRGENGEPGSSVIITYSKDGGLSFLNGGEATVAEDGTWTYSFSKTLEDGEYVFRIAGRDVAGNISTDTADIDGVLIDTIPPVPPSISMTEDTGSSAEDGITTDTKPAFSGQGEADTTLDLYINGKLVGQTVVNSSGNWSFTESEINYSALSLSGTLADGEYEVRAVSSDLAGNKSEATLDMVVDTDVNPNPTIALLATADSGWSNSDNYTGVADVTLHGDGESGGTVVLHVTGAGGYDREYTFTIPEGQTTWQYQLSQFPLAVEGDYTASITLTDVAGNVETSAPVTFYFDNSAPATPTGLDIPAEDDTGFSTTDNITNNDHPQLIGQTEAQAKVFISLENTLTGAVQTFETFADTNGDWTWESASSIDDGTYTVTAQSEDKAGNLSDISNALDPVLVIDTTIAPPSIALDDASDSGRSVDDHITNDQTPTFSGKAEAGSHVSFIVRDSSGTVVDTALAIADLNGDWDVSVSLANALDNGTYQVSVSATDVAGNTSAQTFLSPPLVIDIEPPPAPSVDLSLASNSNLTSDNVTNVDAPVLLGSAVADSLISIEFYLEGVLTHTGTVLTDALGNWVYDNWGGQSLADGEYTTRVTATDTAGNISDVTTLAPPLVIDTEAPALPNVNLISDTGVQGDWLTNSEPVIIGGNVDSAETVRVSVDGNPQITVTPDASGNWSLEIPNYDEGGYEIVVTRVDLAGNESAPQEKLLIIDRSLDTLDIAMYHADDHGDSEDTELITNVDEPRFFGVVDAGSTVVVTLYDSNNQVVGSPMTWADPTAHGN